MNRIFVVLLFLLPVVGKAQIITTFAGRGIGSGGFSGDGGPATAAHIGGPGGCNFDSIGNYYFAIRGTHRIRKVSPLGIITTIAGTGTSGSLGDGGNAATAQLKGPGDVAVDRYGNIYIADIDDNKVRKINALTGIITTYAGNGSGGFAGDGLPATAASLNSPQYLCIDTADNLYISDYNNQRIRKVNSSGIISTVAGNGIAGYSSDGGLADTTRIYHPWGITTDTTGNLYIADKDNYRVRKVNALTGIITTVVGNGNGVYNGEGLAATAAQVAPYAVKFDRLGNLFIADAANERIRKVSTSGFVTTVAGTGVPGFSGDGFAATSAQIYDPEGIALDVCGNLYISDLQNQRIRKVDLSSIITVPSISISGVASASVGASVTVTASVASAGSSYIIYWMNHGIVFTTTTVPSVIYTKGPGIDTITAKVVSAAPYGCYDSTTSAGHIVSGATTGINAPFMQSISIYPNPTHSELTITSPNKIEHITICNLIGQVVYNQLHNSELVTVNVAHLIPGVYFIKINNLEVRRFVKQ